MEPVNQNRLRGPTDHSGFRTIVLFMTSKYFLIVVSKLKKTVFRRGIRNYRQRCVRPTLYLLYHSRLLKIQLLLIRQQLPWIQYKLFLIQERDNPRSAEVTITLWALDFVYSRAGMIALRDVAVDSSIWSSNRNSCCTKAIDIIALNLIERC